MPDLPIRRRRNQTARALAQRFGVTERTIQNHIAEERQSYEERAAQRRQTAGEMADAGASWAEIAAAVGGSEWAARALVRRYREQAVEAKPATKVSRGMRP